MGIRRSLANILLGPPEVTGADLDRVATEAARAGSSGVDPEVDARMAKLEKKLNMAMGAVQAATAQIMSLKKDVEELAALSRQAGQHATTARSTADATADGLSGVEEQLAALVERLGQSDTGPSKAKAAPEKPKVAPKAASKSSASGDSCTVDGCTNKHRARGYCAKHYQQFKRGTLG